MRRGEVWWVGEGPASGGEIQKQRPAVIISNDGSNAHLNRVQVVPLTSNVDRVYAGEALVRVAGRRHKALATQITTVSKERLINRMGRLSGSAMESVELAVLFQLGLNA